MKAYWGEWGVEEYLHAFLTSSLNGGGQIHAPTALLQEKEPLVSTGK